MGDGLKAFIKLCGFLLFFFFSLFIFYFIFSVVTTFILVFGFCNFFFSVPNDFSFLGYSGVLRAGDGIYIPKGFFHYCVTTSRSCSVNFWWL